MIATKRIWTAKPLIVAYIVVLGFTVGLLIDRTPAGKAVPTLADDAGRRQGDDHAMPPEVPIWLQLFRPSQPTARWLLRMGLPMLSVADGSAEAAERRTLVVHWTGRAGEQPQTFFEAMLPFLRPDKERLATRSEPPPVIPPPPEQSKPPVQTEPPKPPAAAGGQPVIGIYHTHDWESYISEFPAFVAKKPEDLGKINSENHSKRTIMEVGRTLALKLKELGVGTVYADYTHRELGYDYAYKASRSTIKDIMGEYPTVKVLLDLHRDEGWGLDLTTDISGKKVAQVRCIIGSGNPHWNQNKAFCDQLMQRLESKYPGITQPTRVQGDTYNQDVARGAILLEIGGAMNQFAEADRAAGYLATVLAEMVRDGAYPK
ncbi:MAG TPA: stage II sporulation protein P [Symbiobacteriaceae bacterium]|nr:stage II sporulation protein P [Symbiobacteriaceae bacterium]